MALAASEIRRALDSGAWKAWRDGEAVTAGGLAISYHSIDVTLQNRLSIVRPARHRNYIDPHDPDTMQVVECEIEAKGWVLMPGDFVLGATRERFDCSAPWQVNIPGVRAGGADRGPQTFYHGIYDGRSTCARLGITSHQSSGYLDFGFASTVTLEITAAAPVLLRAGMRIGQISFSPIQGIPEAYSGAYQAQTGPRAAELGPGRF